MEPRVDHVGLVDSFNRADIPALLKQHRPLVDRLSRQMIAKLSANVEIDDLIQVGMIGLYEALQRFDGRQGVQFDTFASQRIRGSMLDELRGNDWMSRGDRRDQRRIESAIHRVEQQHGRPPSDGEVAREMGLSLTDYQMLLGRVCGVQMVRLEDMGEDYLDCHVAGHADSAADTMDGARLNGWVDDAIQQLPERMRFAIESHYVSDLTLKDIATVLGVTESRVCQLNSEAIGKIKRFVHAKSDAGKPPVRPPPPVVQPFHAGVRWG